MWNEEKKPIPKELKNSLQALKHKRINTYQNLSLVRDKKNNRTFWRHRYVLAASNLHHFNQFEDFPQEQFNNIDEFARFIRDRPLREGQMTLRGAYRKKDTDED